MEVGLGTAVSSFVLGLVGKSLSVLDLSCRQTMVGFQADLASFEAVGVAGSAIITNHLTSRYIGL